jgi:hypothetical protein
MGLGPGGWIFAMKDSIYHEYGVKRVTDRVRKLTEMTLNGEVFVFISERDGEVIDSCSGYYGSDDPHLNGMWEHLSDELKELVGWPESGSGCAS